ncbi:metal ABC transporter permease [bacterium]|nr:metal ABC transporter permease [bacterium]
MTDLFRLFLTHPFIRHALAAAALSSIACGITGTFVVARRQSYLAGGIAHTVLGGLGAAVFLGLPPLLGALGAALAAGLLIGWISLRFSQHEDTIISALWSLGMATGVILLSLTPGYSRDLMSYLFGNILMVTTDGLVVLALLDMVIVAITALLLNQLTLVAFDYEQAAVRGLRADALNLLIICMTAVTVVVLMQSVGLILVIALLTLPAAAARRLTRSIGSMMLMAGILSLCVAIAGLGVSFALNLPAGASIILVTGIGYLLVLGMTALRTKPNQAAAISPDPNHAEENPHTTELHEAPE